MEFTTRRRSKWPPLRGMRGVNPAVRRAEPVGSERASGGLSDPSPAQGCTGIFDDCKSLKMKGTGKSNFSGCG